MRYITDLEIANRALAKIGVRPINSFDEDEESARVAKDIYGTVRDYELSIYRWAFATKRVALAADSDAPAFGYKFQYTLPQDFLRLEELPQLHPQSRDAYSLEHGKLLCNIEGPLHLIYLSRDISQVQLPPYFVEVFATKLAYELCERLKQDASRKQVLMQEYQIAVANAKKSNAIQLAVRRTEPTHWEMDYGI